MSTRHPVSSHTEGVMREKREMKISPSHHLLLLLPLLHPGLAQSQPAPCHLPSGGSAVCVEISQCRHLNKLISNLQRPFPGDVTLLIRDSFLCEATASSVSVCCPLDGISPPLTSPPTSLVTGTGELSCSESQPSPSWP